jgi:quercetin dioxygenase-like cupin family protein
MNPRLLCCLFAVSCVFAQQQPVTEVMWAPKGMSKYTPPHKPHTKLQEVLAKHKGKSDWRELVVDDNLLRSEYVSLSAGGKVTRRLHPDTRAWWVVLDGEIRFDIEGQTPFTAKKGWIVQVPMQTWYTMETAGSKPSVRLETGIAGAKTLYPKDAEPPKLPGVEWLPVRFGRLPGMYGKGNKPYSTFEELAENVEKRGAPITQRVVIDDRGVANFIYGYEKNLPPINPKERGHYHPDSCEFWLIMKGQIRYPIEGQGVIIASEGDLVYVPPYTFHAPRFYGEGPACRLAMNGYYNISHLFDAPKE